MICQECPPNLHNCKIIFTSKLIDSVHFRIGLFLTQALRLSVVIFYCYIAGCASKIMLAYLAAGAVAALTFWFFSAKDKDPINGVYQQKGKFYCFKVIFCQINSTFSVDFA